MYVALTTVRLRPGIVVNLQAFQPEAFWSIKMEYAADDPASPGGKARADFAWQRVSRRCDRFCFCFCCCWWWSLERRLFFYQKPAQLSAIVRVFLVEISNMQTTGEGVAKKLRSGDIIYTRKNSNHNIHNSDSELRVFFFVCTARRLPCNIFLPVTSICTTWSCLACFFVFSLLSLVPRVFCDRPPLTADGHAAKMTAPQKGRLYDHACCTVLYEMTVEDGVAVVTSVEARRVTKARPIPMSTVELQKRCV